MDRQGLHDLVEQIPEADLATAQKFVEYLVASPAFRSARLAPVDEEGVTAEDEAAVERAFADVHVGLTSEMEDVLREFGLA